ncbi:hypothetical protein [Streptomyces sp. bgisy100]|uniref:hypothetical protein n=1 Tax=Streptomyces sp. bgisy100 TaxID=3413783 RepID=UPI003D735CE5
MTERAIPGTMSARTGTAAGAAGPGTGAPGTAAGADASAGAPGTAVAAGPLTTNIGRQRTAVPEDRFRLVVVTGAPGVGKTRLAQSLVARYAVPAAAVDCDPVVHPWESSEKLYALMASTLRATLPVYRAWGAGVVVVSGVVLAGRALEPFLEVFDALGAESVIYGLRAGPDALAARIRKDPGGEHFIEGRLAETHLDEEVAQVPGARQIDTTDLGPEEAVEAVLAMERAELGPAWLGPAR